MIRLIVNADDFGMTEGINRAVLEAHQRGILSSATLLANGAAFASGVAIARDTPALGVGIHLNLTQGRAIAEPPSIPSLVDHEGLFLQGPGPVPLARALLAGRIRLADVERELRGQIEKVLGAGVGVTHLDGHKHFHLLPSIFPIIVRLAREYGIRGMRCPREHSTDLVALLRPNGDARRKILKQYLRGQALRIVSAGIERKLGRAGLFCPAHFYGITQTGFLDARSLERLLARLPPGTSELMCHPGYVDAELRRTPTRLQEQREKELEALTRPEIKRLLGERGIKLISYRGLVDAR